jgi:hypothetical protein
MSETRLKAKGSPRSAKGRVDAFVASWEYDKADKAIVHRIAKFLWAARKSLPGVPVPVTQVARAVNGLARAPRDDSPQAFVVRSALGRVREILRAEHGCSVTTERGLGIRATTDADDQVKTRVTESARRVASAARALASESAIVDPAVIKNKELARFFRTEITPTVKMLEKENLIERLAGILPEAPATAKKAG